MKCNVLQVRANWWRPAPSSGGWWEQHASYSETVNPEVAP